MSRRFEQSWQTYALLGLILAVTAWLRIGAAAIPFERDEGEYAYTAELMLSGTPPYERAYTMKWPGTHAMYASFMATFGHTVAGVRAGFLLMNAATILLCFSIPRRLFTARAGLAAAAAYAILSASPAVFGQAAHATHFVVFFALLGIQFLLAGAQRKSWVLIALAGAACSLAALMKQSGAVFLAMAGGSLAVWALRVPREERRSAWTRLAVFAAAACVPIAAMLGAIAASGAWPKFWFWTVDYAGEYASYRTLSQGWRELIASFGSFLTYTWPIAALAVVGCLASCAEKTARWRVVACAAFATCAFIGTSAALQYRGHYFVLMLPAIALYCGVAVEAVSAALTRMGWARVAANTTCTVLVVGVLARTFLHERALYRSLSPQEAVRVLYDTNPFEESVRIAEYIRAHSSAEDEIGVIGSEPQIPFLAGRRSASGYLYMYGLMEDQPFASRMQDELIAEIEERAPLFLVYVANDLSWLRVPTSSLTVFEWLKKYAGAHYERVGVVEIRRGAPSVYRFDEAAQGKIETPDHVVLFRRRAVGD